MVKEILKIRIDNGLGNSNPTFKDIELDDYSGKFPRMGFPDLTATLMWPTPLDDEWTHKEYVVLRGERFYVTDTPDAEKTNNAALYKHDLGFTSEFARVLGNTFFEDYVPDHSATYNKPCSNSSKFTFYGTIGELCDRLNCSFIKAGIADSILKTKTSLTTLDTPVGDGYCVMLDPYGDYDPDKTYEFSWEDKSHWEAITEGFNITEIPFERRGKCIIFGAVPKVVDHKFEYGHDNELLSIKHKNAKAKVVNRITMQGSTENIPYYYPNETEYGHISIAAKSGNNVLTAANVQIANISQLLSRLNADDFAILRKYEEEADDSASELVTINGYEMYSYDEDEESIYVPYSPNTFKEYRFDNNAWKLFKWPFRIYIDVLESGYVKINNIYADVWFTNSPQPSEPIPVWAVTVDSIHTIGGQFINNDIKSKDDGTIDLGHLGNGKYILDISVNIKNKVADNLNGTVLLVRLQPITAGVYETDEYDSTYQKTGYYWAVGDKKYDGVGALGVKLNADVTDAMIGDGFGWVASGRMPFQTNLIPPKYRNTLGTERFYNALNVPYSEEYASEHPDAYLDPDNIDPTTHKPKPYIFPNPFIEGAPSEHIFRDDDRKPTIEGVCNAVQRRDANGGLIYDDEGRPIYQLLGEIADIAYDADDNDALKSDSTEDKDKNNTLKYEHSFFYIKLNIFNGDYGFDLFAHYSQTDAMTIQMRDGSCNGCKFKIQAAKFTDETGLESYKNPIIVSDGKAIGVVSEDGIKESDLDPTQQNTQTHSIWICVQKDAETFGVIMPNQSNNFKPKIGDKFNIINIDLPQAYILAAEKRLEEDGMRYMLDNNEEKFSFDISASRIFFAEHPSVLSELDEYSKIKVTYNGRVYEQYVNQLTIDCKSNEALPNIGIDLTDTLAVGQSFVEQVAERASSLIANAYTLGGNLGTGGGGISVALAEKRYLNKQKADRTPYKLSSDVGFEVGEFFSGASGGIFFQDPETGQTYIEADKLKIRMKAIFEELEIAKVSTIGGKFIITPGGGITISFVEELTNAYRCYFKAKDEDKGAGCRFVVGDQVQCREFNIQAGTHKNASNRYYWRLVTAVNNDESYIELSKADCDNTFEIPSDAPMAGDTIVQLGNRNNSDRQSAIELSTVDVFAPCIILYTGINNYSLDNKAVVSYGYDKVTGQVFFRLGKSTDSHYLSYTQQNGLEVAGKISVKSTYNDKPLGDYISDAAQLAADDVKSELQDQIDGVIESFNGFGEPTLSNYPADEWTTDEERHRHDRDIYTDITPYVDDNTTPTSGQSWKWYYNSPTDYGWTKIADSEAVRALQLAQLSVTGVDVLYTQSNSEVISPTLPSVNPNTGQITNLNGWSTKAPEWQDGMYMWQLTYARYGDGSYNFAGPTCIAGATGQTGPQGPQGVPGAPGADGTTYYTWIRYADDAQGNGISNNPSGKKYIGFAYNKTTATESNNKTDYTWSEIKGEQGVPGAKGADGTTYYTWIQYSDNADGNPMYQQPNANTKYIGIAVNKETATEGNNPADYTWSLFKGADGTNITISSQSVKYSTNHGATQPADSTFTLNDVPTLTAGEYLWSMTTVVYSNGQSTKSYAVSRIGVDGENGASYSDNLLLKTDVVASNGDYLIAIYDLAENPVVGEDYTFTLWGQIASSKTNFSIYNSGGIIKLSDLDKVSDGVYHASFKWENHDGANIANDTTVAIFAMTSAQTGVSTIEKVKLEKGVNDTPVWTPASSEMLAPFITSTSVTYAKNTTGTQPADSAFTYSSIGAVGLGTGDYLWTKTVVTYSDGSETKSYSVGRIGSDGTDGLPGTPGADGKTTYVHFAYASAITGNLPHPTSVVGFSTTAFAGAKYIGVCTDYNQADPTTNVEQTYEWSEYKGEDGASYASNLLIGSKKGYMLTNADSPNATSYSSAINAEGFLEYTLTVLAVSSRQYRYLWVTNKLAEYFQEGETYTLSVEVKSTAAGYVNIDSRNNSNTNVKQLFAYFPNTNGQWQRVSGKVKFTGLSNNDRSLLSLVLGSSTAGAPVGSTVTIRKLCLTKGDSEVWTPAASEMLAPTITEQYFKSTSNTALTGGSWEDNNPGWSAGYYIWTRSKIVYGSGEIVYTDPVCATGATGSAAPNLVIQYSADATNWHPVYAEGDIWMRTSNDGGGNWSAAVRIQGSNYTPNLLLGTKDWSGGWYAIASATNVYSKDGTYNDLAVMHGQISAGDSYKDFRIDGLELKPNTVYTLSVWAKGSGKFQTYVYPDVSARVISVDGDSGGYVGNDSQAIYTLTSEWKRHYVVFRTKNQALTNKSVIISRLITNATEIWFCGAKLEEGDNRNTEWTPAASEMVGQDGPWRKFQWAIGSETSVTGTWQDTPMNASAGQYVWMRSGLVVPPATAPATWGTAVRLTGDTGAAGQDTYRLDLSNEVAGVACDAAGAVTGTLPTSNITVYKGATVDSGWTFSVATSGCTASIASGNLSITMLTADAGTATVTATKSGYPTLQATMSVYKVKPGEDAVVYELEPSADNITINPLGVYSSTQIKVSKYKTTGTKARELTAECTLRYRVAGVHSENQWLIPEQWDQPNKIAIISVSSNIKATAIIVELLLGSDVLDRERIPVIREGGKITENLVRNSEVEITATTTKVGRFLFGKNIVAGTTYTFTVWGALGSGRTNFKVANTLGTVSIVDLVQIAPGIYSGSAVCPSGIDTRYFDLYQYPVSLTSETTVTKVKVEEGQNPYPLWTSSPYDVDYLTRALKEDGEMKGGLVLASLVRLGFTQQNGEYTTMAGINGIAVPEDAIAVWGGGEMIDRANYSSPPTNAAKFALRHNGTAYFASNTVRMGERIMQVGDNVQLDDKGLSLNIGSNTALHIGDVSVGNVSTAIPTNTDLTGGNNSITINNVRIYQQGVTYIPEGSNEKTYVTTSIAGSVFNAKGTISWEPQTSVSINKFATNVNIDLIVGGSVVTTRSYPMEIQESKLVANFDLGPIRLAGGSVALRLYFSNSHSASDSEIGGPITGPTLTITEGSISYNAGNQTTFGNNGLLSVWGQSTLICKEDGVEMRFNNYILRVSSLGIQKSTNGGNSWSSL